MELEDFAVDPGVYEDGKRIDFSEDSYIRIRSAGSSHAQKVRERLWKPYATWTDIPRDVLDRLNAQWIAEGLLAEFVGFTVDGKPLTVDLTLEADRKQLADVLKAARFKAMRTRFIQMSLDEKTFQDANDAVLEKNSASSRAGRSSGANTPNE